MTKYSELYACLYAKEFPAQAMLRLRPDLRDKPFIVMEGEPPLQHVCSLNRKASRLGVSRGMTQVEVDTFPSVELLSRSGKKKQPLKLPCLSVLADFRLVSKIKAKSMYFSVSSTLQALKSCSAPQTPWHVPFESGRGVGYNGLRHCQQQFSFCCLSCKRAISLKQHKDRSTGRGVCGPHFPADYGPRPHDRAS